MEAAEQDESATLVRDSRGRPHEPLHRKRDAEGTTVMSSKYLLFSSLAGLLLVVLPDGAVAQLPNCDCYYNADCPAAAPAKTRRIHSAQSFSPSHRSLWRP